MVSPGRPTGTNKFVLLTGKGVKAEEVGVGGMGLGRGTGMLAVCER